MLTKLFIALYGIPTVFAQQPGGNPPASRGSDFWLYDPLGCGGASDGGLTCVLKGITGSLKLIAIPIVSIMVIVGAFQILTAAGKDEQISKGKKTILYAVIGMAIILISDGIAGIIKSVVVPGK